MDRSATSDVARTVSRQGDGDEAEPGLTDAEPESPVFCNWLKLHVSSREPDRLILGFCSSRL